MDARSLGFALGQTPYEDNVIIDFDGGGLSCGTGDHFVSAPQEMVSDLVDRLCSVIGKWCSAVCQKNP